MRQLRWLVPACVLLLPATVAAQDRFETEVYGYQTAEKGEWELEGQLNYVADGTTEPEGDVIPTEHVGHVALEVTHGLTRLWEVGAYLLAGFRSGPGVEYAGSRLRTRVRVPEGWHLPVDMSLGAELEFTQPSYDESAVGLEFRPTLGRRFGRFQVDVNPIVERSLKEHPGGAEQEGWEFEPSARLGFTLGPSLDLAVEYYGKTGVLGSSLPADQQVHMFYPSVDWKLGDDVKIHIGVGFGTTPAWNQLVLNSRFEVPLREGH